MLLLAAVNWHSVMFLVFALVACGFGAAVLLTNNIVRMAFYLTLSLGAIAGLFILAGAEFVGAMQLMIYVGGTLVLLIFGVMLTAQQRFVSMQTSSGEWVLGGGVGAMLLGVLVSAAFSVDDWTTPRVDVTEVTLADSNAGTPIGMALAGVRVDKLDQTNEQLRDGMSGYLLPFVIVSVHLLVVLIGAGYMARTKRIRGAAAYAQPVAAAARDRRRSFFVTVGLVKGLVINLLLAAVCLGLMMWPLPTEGEAAAPAGSLLLSAAERLAATPDWLLPTLGLLFLANVLLLVVVWYWQKWGVVGLVVVPMLQAFLIGNSALGQTVAIGFAALALLPVAALIILLSTGRQPTAWSQMD
jgi:NADH-quinone oxidoreductase subunit J